MSSGEGLVGLLYALKGIFEAGVIWILTAAGVLAFFRLIIYFIGAKAGISIFKAKSRIGIDSDPNKIMWALFILTIIFALYSFIGLTADIFGLNSAPVGGIYKK